MKIQSKTSFIGLFTLVLFYLFLIILILVLAQIALFVLLVTGHVSLWWALSPVFVFVGLMLLAQLSRLVLMKKEPKAIRSYIDPDDDNLYQDNQ